LIHLACSQAPDGWQRWTLELLADQMVHLGYVEHISPETVRKALKKTSSSRGSKNPGVFPNRQMQTLSSISQELTGETFTSSVREVGFIDSPAFCCKLSSSAKVRVSPPGTSLTRYLNPSFENFTNKFSSEVAT